MASRQSELEHLKALWHTARVGQPQLCLVQAAAGLGKSYVLQEFAKTIDLNSVFTVRQNSFVSGLLSATHSALQAERDPDYLSAALRYAPNLNWQVVVGSHTQLEPDRALFSLAHALERYALRVGGLCLLLEDLHEYNADSVQALRFLYRQWLFSSAPILLVLSARPELLDSVWDGLQTDTLLGASQAKTQAAGQCSKLELSVLGAQGVKNLAEHLLPTAVVPNDFHDWLFARSEGHPLYATELLRFVLGGRALQNLGATWQFIAPSETTIPQNLEALLFARLELVHFEPETWLALSSLAILGFQTDLGAWRSLTGLSSESMQRVIRRLLTLGLVRSHLINTQAQYEITHPLYPPLITSLLEQTQANILHTKALEITKDLGQRARHARAASHEQAFEMTQLAFKHSIERYAWADVEEHGKALLEMPQTINIITKVDHQDIIFNVGRAIMLQNRFTQSIAYFSQLETPQAKDRHAYALARLVRDREGLAFTERYIEQLNWSVRYYWTCFPMRLGMKEVAKERLEMAFALSPENTDERLYALFCEHWFVKIYQPHRLGRQVDIFNAVREIKQVLDGNQNRASFNWQADAFADLGKLESAENVMQQVLEEFRLKPNDSIEANIFVSLGKIAFSSGRYLDARQHFLAALRVATLSVDPIHQSYAHYGLYRIDFALGLETRDHLARYYATNAAMENILYDAPTDLEIAWREASLGRLSPEARENVTDSLQQPLGSDCLAAARLLILEGNDLAALEALGRWRAETWSENGVLKTQSCPAEHAFLEAMALRSGSDSVVNAAFESALSFATQQNNQHLIAEIQLSLSLVKADPDLQALEKLKTGNGIGHALWLRHLYPGALESLEFGTAKGIQAQARFIRTFGGFGIEFGGKLKPWKAQKTRDLLALLICASLDGRGFVSRDFIIDTIWADDASENADGVFRMTVSRLRESLGDAATIERDEQGRYGLKDAKIDAKHFLESLSRHDLERAATWYSGTFLANIDLEAAGLLREKLRIKWRSALLQLAFEGNDARAATHFETLLESDPFDLEALQGLVKSWRALGANLRLQRILEKTKERFLDEFGEIPVELIELLEQVKSQTFARV